MNLQPDMPMLIDRSVVEDATVPGSLACEAGFLFAAPTAILFVAPLVLFPFSAGALAMAATALFPAGLAAWTVARWLRRRRRHRRLQLAGRRHAATAMRSVCVRWVARRRIFRWTIVAQWSGEDRVERCACSASFDYDPQPLLDDRVGTVLADPQDETNAILLAEGLPPRRHRSLGRTTAASVPPNPMLREQRIAGIVALVVLLAMAAFCWVFMWPHDWGGLVSGIAPGAAQPR